MSRGDGPGPRARARPAAFIDRDGVLNVDRGYVYRAEDFVWVKGAKKAVKVLNDLGYFVFIVTNQAGIARGYYGPNDVERLHDWINAELRKVGAHVDGFYYCPHHPDAGPGPYTRACDCRKPAPGMLLQAIAEWPVDRARSFVVGDHDIDMEAARRAGLRGVMFQGGSLLEVVENIIG